MARGNRTYLIRLRLSSLLSLSHKLNSEAANNSDPGKFPKSLKKAGAILICLLPACLIDQGPSSAAPRRGPLSDAHYNGRKSKFIARAAQHPAPVLEVDKRIEVAIKAGEESVFKAVLKQGEYFKITVEQRGIDVALSIIGPDDEMVADMDSPNGAFGGESVSMVAQASGVHFIKVRASGRGGGAGRYEITALRRQHPSSAELSHIAGERAFRQAMGLRDPDSREKAIEKFKEALSYYREAEDRHEEAKTLYMIALRYRQLNKNQEALQFFETALNLQQEIGDLRGEAFTLKEAAQAYAFSGNLSNAIDYARKSIEILRMYNDLSNEAGALNTIGNAYGYLGNLEESLKHHNRVLEIRKSLGDMSGVFQSYNNIGVAYDMAGELQKGLDSYYEALSLSKQIANPSPQDMGTLASTLNNLGNTYAMLGDLQTAFDFYNQSIQIQAKISPTKGLASALVNMGNAYLWSGNPGEALKYFGQALPKQAEWGSAYTLMSVGDAYAATGEPQKALESFDKALKTIRELDDRLAEAGILDKRGKVLASLRRWEEAERSCADALAIWQKFGDRRGEATTYYTLARLNAARGEIAKAYDQIQTALTGIESVRVKLFNRGLRAYYSMAIRDYYNLGIDILIQLHERFPNQGYNVKALEMSERGRTRALIEAILEARADVRQDADPELLLAEKQLQQQINATASRLFELNRGRVPEEQKAEVAKRLRGLEAEHNQFFARGRAQSPRLAELTRPSLFNIADIQKSLDADTLILEFWLGDERSYLWAIGRESVKSFLLPGRVQIEESARRVYSLLKLNGKHVVEKASKQARSDRDAPTRDYAEASTTLSKLVLGPVAPLLGTKRLIIVSDGALQYIPFIALPEPGLNHSKAGSDSAPVIGDATPLIERHIITYLPSAAMRMLSREPDDRKRADKILALIADPVFGADDERAIALKKKGRGTRTSADKSEAGGTPETVIASITTAHKLGRDDGVKFSRLPWTAREAEAIASILSPKGLLKAVGFKASRATALDPALAQYRIIHLATHGIMDSEYPELSGLVLSLIDESGRPQKGFLWLQEIYGLKLSADLVVLSACDTGLGKEIRSEGLIGLTRGFMHAGAKSVMASLWKVEDSGTAVLMENFYRAMILEGMHPAEALRAAQLKLSKQTRWKSPHHWAAFILQGE